MNIFPVLAILVAESASSATVPRVLAVSIDGVVHPISVEIVGHALEQAKRDGAGALLIRINTPGGMLDATRQVNEKIIAAPVPVITFVTPSGGRAASAGFFILQAGDVAAMAPGTNTGAASPVLLGEQMEPVMRAKVESYAAATLRSLTSKRGRNTKLAEEAVLKARSFTEKEALESKLIEIIAKDDRDLFEQLQDREVERFDGSKQKLRLAGAVVSEYQPTTRERLMSALSDPNLAFVMLILGALGLYIEFTTPGVIFPGVGGGILALLALSALAVFPINWVGVALLILAGLFFVLEAKFNSHGVLGAGGAIAMVLGALLLVDGPPEMRIRLGTALGVTLPFSAITLLLVTLVVRARANKVITGEGAMVGEVGVVRTSIDPKGMVQVHGEYWNAIADCVVPAGAPVRVVAVHGLTLKVEPVSG